MTLYGQAVGLDRDGDLTGAQVLMERAFRAALANGNTPLALELGLQAALLLNNTHRIPEAGRMAREVLALKQATPERLPMAEAYIRAQLLGLLERSLQLQGQVGAGWQACRSAVATLRQNCATPETGGAPVTLEELDRLPPQLRDYGWRLLQREAEYLEVAGRSKEALDLLAAAAAKARAAMPSRPADQQFYLFKLRASYAEHLDFMGWQAEAIAEQERILAESRMAPDHPSRLNLKLNLLRNRSQWQGPSEAILAEARQVGERLNANNPNHLVDRLLAKMEMDLKESSAALATLAKNIADAERAGVWFDAVYARRDSLLARAGADEDRLDGEFAAILTNMRANGNKGGEPTVYAEYGEYLSDRGRHAEAITMLREALRMVRAFGRTNHEPSIRSRIIAAQVAAGDLDGASDELSGLEEFLAAHPELPLYRRTAPAIARVRVLLASGKTEEARQVYAAARKAAKSLPAAQQHWFAPEIESALFASPRPPAIATTRAAAPPVRIQPVEIETVAVPGKTAETRFFAINAHLKGIRGQLVATGPGAEVKDGKLLIHAGLAPRVAALPVAIEAGGATAVFLTAQPDPAQPSCEVRLVWRDAGGTAGKPAKWLARWDPASVGNIVLDAGMLEADPFYSACFTHHLAVPSDGRPAVAFRLWSPEPLRVEYYDASNGRLLAVDANGNGDFSEEGDLHVVDASGVAAAWISTPLRGNLMPVELRLFSPGGAPPGLRPEPLVIRAEVNRNGDWILAAEDILR